MKRYILFIILFGLAQTGFGQIENKHRPPTLAPPSFSERRVSGVCNVELIIFGKPQYTCFCRAYIVLTDSSGPEFCYDTINCVRLFFDFNEGNSSVFDSLERVEPKKRFDVTKNSICNYLYSEEKGLYFHSAEIFELNSEKYTIAYNIEAVVWEMRNVIIFTSRDIDKRYYLAYALNSNCWKHSSDYGRLFFLIVKAKSLSPLSTEQIKEYKLVRSVFQDLYDDSH